MSTASTTGIGSRIERRMRYQAIGFRDSIEVKI
jgi:hypothetical protein